MKKRKLWYCATLHAHDSLQISENRKASNFSRICQKTAKTTIINFLKEVIRLESQSPHFLASKKKRCPP